MMNQTIKNIIQFSYDKQPLAIFLLGTNGSGKSTLRHYLDLSEININIDPDLLNKAYSNKYPTNYQIEASKEAILQYNNAIKKGLNVCIESTLSGYGIMRRIKLAKMERYQISEQNLMNIKIYFDELYIIGCI